MCWKVFLQHHSGVGYFQEGCSPSFTCVPHLRGRRKKGSQCRHKDKNTCPGQKKNPLSAANWTETPNLSPRPLGSCQIQTFHCSVSLGEAQLDNPDRETLTNRNKRRLLQKTRVASPDKLLMSSCPIKFWKAAWFTRNSFQYYIWGFLLKISTGKLTITCWQTHRHTFEDPCLGLEGKEISCPSFPALNCSCLPGNFIPFLEVALSIILSITEGAHR